MSDKRIDALRKTLAEQQINAAVLLYSRDLLYYADVSIPSILLITPQTSRLHSPAGICVRTRQSWCRPDGSLQNRRTIERGETERTRMAWNDVIRRNVPQTQSELPDAQFNISPHIYQRIAADRLKLVHFRDDR
jgi:hypothetical protein